MNSNNIKKICRFAPSPTGFLHVGNIRAAIINFLYAKKIGGDFILRLDDTDDQRVTDEYRDGIIEDMAWLGLEYSQLIHQSDYLKSYDEVKNKLIKVGRLYECYETKEDLNLQRKSQIAQGLRPIYNRAALNLTDEQKENYKKQGIEPYYRFLLKDQESTWEDKVKGRISFSGLHFSDPVLIRENNVPTYTFCSVIDDIAFNITDIIRGEDHITNTVIQIQIFEALEGLVPDFSHLALIKAKDGKISKRVGGFDIRSLRKDGFEPLAIINLLSQIGTSKGIDIVNNIDDLVKNFDLNNFSKSSTNYDLDELVIINHKLLQITPFSQIQPRLKEIGFDDKVNEEFWLAIRPNLNYLYEIKAWWKICKEEFRHQNDDGDKEFLSQISNLLPDNTSSEDSWSIWLEKIKTNTDRKGKTLFMPIRLALTGQEHGPEMKNILPLIQRDEIISRLVS